MGEDILGIGHWFRSEFQVHGTQPESASQKREDVIGIGRCFKSDFMCIVMFEAGRKFSNRRERYLLLILARPILESNRKVPRNRCDSRPWIGGNNRNRSMPSKNFHGLVYYPTPWSGPRPRISMLMIAVWFDFHHWNLGVWGYGADCLPFLPFLIFSPIYGHHLGVVSGCKRKGW